MPLNNYTVVSLRDSAATSGAAEQDDQVTLPETVTEVYVVVDKTAEANADNLLTTRLQGLVNSIWFDLSWDSLQLSAGTATQSGQNIGTTRTPNIHDASDSATPTYTAYYKSLPTNIVRIISISSGTAVANTFSASAEFRQTTNR